MSAIQPASRRRRRGKACIYWCSNTGDDELSVGRRNRIDIQVTHVPAPHGSVFDEIDNRPQPDNRTKYVSMHPAGGRFDSRNPAPFAENTPRPDTGYSGTMIKLNLLFEELERVPSAADEWDNRAGGIARIIDWSRRDNSVRGKFKHGRIGFRNDYRPELNTRPDNFGGFKLAHYEFDSESKENYYTRMQVILQYSGAPGNTELDARDVLPRLGNTHTEREQTNERPQQ